MTNSMKNYDKDNEAILAVAYKVSAASNPKKNLRQIKQQVLALWNGLIEEGKGMPLHAPTPEELETFFSHQTYLIEDIVSDKTEATKLIDDLVYAQQNTGDYLKPHVFYTWQHIADLASYEIARTQNENPLIIAVDLDGCLYDFNSVMRDWLIYRGWEPEVLIDPQEYNIQKEWGITVDTFHSEMVESLHEGIMFRQGEAFPEAILAVQKLGLEGHTIMANSARHFEGLHDKTRSATIQWLREHTIHPDIVHLVNPKNTEDKLLQYFDLLVDDHPFNVEYAINAGRNAVLLDRPWNRNVDHLPRATYEEIAADPHKYVIIES